MVADDADEHDAPAAGSAAQAPARKPRHLHARDLHGAGLLAIDATLGLIGLVEAVHASVAPTEWLAGRRRDPTTRRRQGRTRGLTGLVYRSVRGVTRLAGGGLDALLGQLAVALGAESGARSAERDAVVAALNGVLGDHLAATGNPLATPMRVLHDGRPLVLEPGALAAAVPDARGHLLLMIHGLCMNARQWQRHGHDHGTALARDGGFSALYLDYNSGLHVSANGRLLADLLDTLAASWPASVEQITIVAHSMGGLVARSACLVAQSRGDAWFRRLASIVVIATPHHGAPLERGGHWIDVILEATPYTAAFARLGKLRSAGITDLRHGNVRDEDWAGGDRFAHRHDTRVPAPLPDGVACHAIAGLLARAPSELGDQLVGDGLVPLDSALGRHAQAAHRLAFAPERQWIGRGIGHLELLERREVLGQLRRWLIAGANAPADGLGPPPPVRS